MNLDCTTPKYGELYARWLANPGKLLDLAGMRHGDRVLDLCGGTGIVSRAALDRGALRVVLLDLMPRATHPLISQVQGRAEDADQLLQHDGAFDLVVCRQSIGYLDMKQVAAAIHQVLRPGGRFVFNTFTKPRWALKTYALGGTRFVEASGYLGHTVIHVQAGRGLGIDVTRFRWYHDWELRAALVPYFEIHEIDEGRSIYYVCTKREIRHERS
jgi:ubiquinone/menaquinone biosynthesis C-methylase UbiE